MKYSNTYRITASLLIFCIILGVSMPAGLHAKSIDECEAMGEMHIDHEMPESDMIGHDSCPMDDHHQQKPHQTDRSLLYAELHDLGFACACNIEDASVKTEAPVFKKVKMEVVAVVQIITEYNTTQTEPDNHAIQISGSYSPPPIFLVNESFLI